MKFTKYQQCIVTELLKKNLPIELIQHILEYNIPKHVPYKKDCFFTESCNLGYRRCKTCLLKENPIWGYLNIRCVK